MCLANCTPGSNLSHLKISSADCIFSSSTKKGKLLNLSQETSADKNYCYCTPTWVWETINGAYFLYTTTCATLKLERDITSSHLSKSVQICFAFNNKNNNNNMIAKKMFAFNTF